MPPLDSPASDLKQTPLWWETAPRERDSGATLPRSADIVIIGAGYTGLSCALALARRGLPPKGRLLQIARRGV